MPPAVPMRIIEENDVNDKNNNDDCGFEIGFVSNEEGGLQPLRATSSLPVRFNSQPFSRKSGQPTKSLTITHEKKKRSRKNKKHKGEHKENWQLIAQEVKQKLSTLSGEAKSKYLMQMIEYAKNHDEIALAINPALAQDVRQKLSTLSENEKRNYLMSLKAYAEKILK